MQLNGAEIVIECLKEQGVDTVFGYPGGAILNVYDELYKHRDEIRHILTSHEQGASHAADGYARATGKVGVCLATSGPGATNLVTGIATAYMDSIPIVAITCNVGVSLLGKDSFQEIDIAGITMPITKYSFIVKDVTKLADTIRKAFPIAKTGRPGPVLVDIPKDITAKVTEYIPEELGKCTKEDSSRKTPRMDEQRFDRVISMLEEAEKPFVATLASVIVYSLVSIFMYMIGMGAAIFTGEYDIAQIMLKTGFGVVGLLIIVFSTVTTTFLDAYSAGVSSVSISSKIQEKWAAIVVTVIGTVAAIVYPMDNITNFLYLIGSVFAPMIAVQIADYFILKKADAGKSAFQWRNLIVWLAGFIIYRILMHVDTPLGNTLPDMVITVVLCLIVEKAAGAVKSK